VLTAVGVATVSAAALFWVDQLEISAVAAASAPGFNEVGRATGVVVRGTEDDVVTRCALLEGELPEWGRWTYAKPNKLTAKTPKTTP
jgi:hypothetical protein